MKIQIDKQKLEELISSNWKRKEIADFFHVSTKTISERVKEYGLTFKKETKSKEVFICKTCGKEYHQSIYHPYCCKVCAGKINTETYVKPTTELGKKIVELRNQGKSYKQIIEELGCNKSTIAYYCSPLSKTKKKEYIENTYPSYLRILTRRLSAFQNRQIQQKVRFDCEDYKQSIRSRVSNFVGNWEYINKMKANKRFGYKEVLDYIGGWETECYLTGRKLDLRKDAYELDHIIPISKGGDCTLENLGVTCEEANQSKHDMLLEDYLQLCKDVLEHHGYKVEKI